MTIDLSKDPTDIVDLLPGRAGRGRGTYKPMLIVAHIQEGTNYLPVYFSGVQADSTMWCNTDGTLVRMLYDTDDAWTNGDWTEPVNHANPIIEEAYKLTMKNDDNSNVVSLTVECAGVHTADITPAQYASLAKLCAYWCNKYGWEPTRQRIVGHYEVGEHKQCPGKVNLDRVVALTQGLMQNSGVNKVSDNFPKAFNPNPLNKDVGSGVLEVLTNERMTAITNEDYYVPAGNKPGLTERSFTYANKDGVTLRVDAIQDQDASGKPLLTWKREIWQLIKEIK